MVGDLYKRICPPLPTRLPVGGGTVEEVYSMTLDVVERLIQAALGKLSHSPSHTEENRVTSAMLGISESLLKSGSSLADEASQERLLIIHLAAFSTAVYFWCSVRADLRSYVAHTRFERFLRHLYLQYIGRRSLLNVYTNLARNALSVSMNLQVGNSPSQLKTQALALCTRSVLQEDRIPLSDQEVQELKRSLEYVSITPL